MEEGCMQMGRGILSKTMKTLPFVFVVVLVAVYPECLGITGYSSCESSQHSGNYSKSFRA